MFDRMGRKNVFLPVLRPEFNVTEFDKTISAV